MSKVTLDSVLDEVMLLEPKERDMLVEIVRSRQIELEREDILRDAEEGLRAHERGELRPQTASEIIKELHRSLGE